MSNEEAILHMILRREELKNSVGDLDEDIKAFDMAIRALELTQTGLLNYSKGWHDAIGKALNEAYDVVIDGERFSVVQEETLLGLGMSSELPPVSTEKTGHWIDTGSGQMCSRCGEIQYGYDSFRRFCASCGIRMVEPQESGDAISRQREKNISKGFEDFMIKSLQKQAESEDRE